MIRNMICVAVAAFFSVALVMAKEINGNIVAVSDTKVTIKIKKDTKDTKDLEVAKACKVFKMVKGNKEELPGRMTQVDAFVKIKSNTLGIAAKLITDDSGKVTEIILGASRP